MSLKGSKVIVSDASPIIALDDIGRISLLKDLYSEIIVTGIVRNEIEAELPPWITINNTYDIEKYRLLQLTLDDGEASAIALAASLPGTTLIIDERRGRGVAKSLGISVIGLLGLIILAKNKELIDSGKVLLKELEDHGFWLSTKLKSELLTQLGEV